MISDVLGDPLELIASGPTVADTSTPADALAVLERYGAREAAIAPAVFARLERGALQPAAGPTCRVSNHVIGNNRTAVEAAAAEARRRGYRTEATSAAASEGAAEAIGVRLAEKALAIRNAGEGPTCLVDGGEPTVKLVDAARRGKGGRNQQLILAAADRLRADGAARILMLSGGTDGEDGPTAAAGARVDSATLAAAAAQQLDPRDFLSRNDAYHWFEPLGALLKTGPTHTNVCDLRVILVD